MSVKTLQVGLTQYAASLQLRHQACIPNDFCVAQLVHKLQSLTLTANCHHPRIAAPEYLEHPEMLGGLTKLCLETTNHWLGSRTGSRYVAITYFAIMLLLVLC